VESLRRSHVSIKYTKTDIFLGPKALTKMSMMTLSVYCRLFNRADQSNREV
jgi:hypothetical protein